MSSPARTDTLTWDRVQVGDAPTPLTVNVTSTLIVAGAIASRDYMPVHHDKAFAEKQGSPDIFMNILTSNGYCLKFLTEWAGPETMLTALSVRLGVPAFPNDPLAFTGEVTGKDDPVDGFGLVHVSLKAANSLGDHVVGTATVSLPAKAAE